MVGVHIEKIARPDPNQKVNEISESGFVLLFSVVLDMKCIKIHLKPFSGC